MDLNFYSIDFFMNSRKFKSFTLTKYESMEVSRQNYYALANYVPATYVKELR